MKKTHLDKRSLDYKNDILHMNDICIEKIIQKYETPFYLYSMENIISHIRLFSSSFPKPHFLICYAVKANPHKAILHHIAHYGWGADVVSYGEMYKSLESGISPQSIVFSGVGKNDKEISYALSSHIRQINVESLSELYRIKNISQKIGIRANISIRIQPNISAGAHDGISTGKEGDKFGIPIHEVDQAYRYIRMHDSLHLEGFSYHIGSQIHDIDKFRQSIHVLRDTILACDIRKVNSVDVGGGIGINYHNKDMTTINLDQYTTLLCENFINTGITKKIIVEPGRSIVGHSAILVTRIIAVKKINKKYIIILDCGMNNLMRPSLYNSYHHILPIKRTRMHSKKYTIVGNICETTDTFHNTFTSNYSFEEGDIVSILDVGAYGHTMSSHYNSRNISAEIAIHNNNITTITPCITAKDFFAMEKKV